MTTDASNKDGIQYCCQTRLPDEPEFGKRGEHVCPHCGRTLGFNGSYWYLMYERPLVANYPVPVAKGGEAPFPIGDKVQRKGSDYHFPGVVVAVFNKLSGQRRYVVEDDRGTLFVQSDKTLEARHE